MTGCDHRHESRSYQPNDTLRHLVQVRDGTCTFPPCSRHARESDFEHAVPYDQGGRTCACNGGARSRRCHRVKQSTGWTVTQPQPGWHQWTTPAGRTYTQGPMQYPALYQLHSSPSCERLGACTRLCRPYGSRILKLLAGALADLRLSLVPRAPGFVSAYWLAPVDGIGMSVIVFDTKEHADEATRYPVPPLPGVTPLTVDIREVYASA